MWRGYWVKILDSAPSPFQWMNSQVWQNGKNPIQVSCKVYSCVKHSYSIPTMEYLKRLKYCIKQLFLYLNSNNFRYQTKYPFWLYTEYNTIIAKNYRTTSRETIEITTSTDLRCTPGSCSRTASSIDVRLALCPWQSRQGDHSHPAGQTSAGTWLPALQSPESKEKLRFRI